MAHFGDVRITPRVTTRPMMKRGAQFELRNTFVLYATGSYVRKHMVTMYFGDAAITLNVS